MRDPGLEEAVRAVGGVSELARQIGISQPSVSNWNRIPAERVLIVEAATGVDRKVLRPDLYSGTGEDQPQRPTTSPLARAQEYALLATLLARAPDAKLLRQSRASCAATPRRSASRMPRWRRPPAKPRSSASSASSSISSSGSAAAKLLPYGSYYLTGFLHERPLARLRGDLARSASSAPRATASPKITPRSCARSWPALVERPSAGAAGHRPADFREASGALDRPLLRRSGAGRSGQSSIAE